MASRPVASRGGGMTGAHYGMIAFAILTVASLGLFVFTMTQVKGAQEEADRAQRQMQQYGRPPAYYSEEARARNSNVFAVMADDIRKVASLITGNPEDVGATIEIRAQQLLNDVAAQHPGVVNPGDTLVTAVDRLNAALATERAHAQDLTQANTDLEGEVARLTEQLKVKEDEFAAEVQAIGQQLQQVQESNAEALEQKEGQFSELQASLTESESELQRLRREQTNERRETEAEILALETRIANLQRDIQQFKLSFDPRALLTKADGRIVRAIPGSDVVYINLGASEAIKPGMGFEIFSQTGDVPEGLSGKASLEVVTVMEETAECRVTRRERGRPIIEGDIVVNIAFERDRKPKFVVRGEFDVNYDGAVDFDGLEQIEGLIRQWGGQVVDELDESVDFVVIGLPPVIPSFARDLPVSEVVREQQLRSEIDLAQFKALVERAKGMHIPVITQSPFMYLIGYPGDGSIRSR